MIDKWSQVEQNIENFCHSIAGLGPQYAALCVVNDALLEQSASEGVGLQDRNALCQVFTNMLHTAARENDWHMEDVEDFLTEVLAALRVIDAYEGFSNLSPTI